MSNFFVPNLRNSLLLHAICALNLSILHRNLLCPDLIRGSLVMSSTHDLALANISSSFFFVTDCVLIFTGNMLRNNAMCSAGAVK